jgi:plasmid rolling circle replication initiator protein Rep
MSVHRDLPLVHATGEILTNERVDWADEKFRSLAISEAINIEKRKQRIYDCSSELCFAVEKLGKKHLIIADFCKDRMCPSCQRRRSLKVFHQIKKICCYIVAEQPTVSFMMLTLTIPNVHRTDLPATIAHMMKSYERLFRRAEVKKGVLGWFRSLEITKQKNKDDYYHPHFHVLIAVRPSYFSTNYITQDRWLNLWREATRQPEIMIVDIRKIKPNKKGVRAGEISTNSEGGSSQASIAGAAAEVGKYATKPSDYLTKDKNDMYFADPDTVNTLAACLHGVRLIAFGGLLLEIKSLLSIDDAESEKADLINLGDDVEILDAVVRQVFKWNYFNRLYIN